MIRWLGLALAVLAAMTLGRVITEGLDDSIVAEAPFARSGAVGRTVELEYGRVTVQGVRAARRLTTYDGGRKASGTFLLIDLDLEATRAATAFSDFRVIDQQGREFVPTDRANCAGFVSAPAGVPWHALLCLDLPQDALEGARLVVSRGNHGVDGSGQRRDDQAVIDLGIDAVRADELWKSRVTYPTAADGPEPHSTEPVDPS